ncbi:MULTISPECIES: DUF4336 domain-containing protein [Halomonadaceae]|uniref:DUF4336 domain-containing protein n=1 Tax=Halomonadaceae TaxID=28256 RepID=UPI001583778A|nr:MULTISPECIES: DUF4336 domain-containing protein [Halomonas]MDI4636098.1 DUF4336 domain-containing protein [Halomonas sp. BMC7]NUJ60464.1 DUF4336 domain-containing protein [Halomonas taeanensis]
MRYIAENIWIFDGEAVKFYSLPYTTRMTVIALSSGDLWIHSPIKLEPAIQAEVEALGRVKYIIAPNRLHHLFIKQWQQAYPEALVYGTEEVINKRSDLSFDGTLDNATISPWDREIGQLLVTGSPAMKECVFFHKTSGVLIVTDLIENFSPKALPFFKRQVARLSGILAPNGKMPIDWRYSFYLNKAEIRRHIETILSWKPEKIILAHGLIIEENAEDFLRQSFNWLRLTN